MNLYRNQKVLTTTLWRPLLYQVRMKCSIINTSNHRYLEKSLLTFRITVKRTYESGSSKSIPKKFRKKLLPFEVEASEKDILLFSHYSRDRFFKYIGFGGIFLCFAFLNSADLMYKTFRPVAPIPPDAKYPWYNWWRKVDFQSQSVRKRISSFVALFGIIVLGCSLAYPTRFIREVTLLRGGEKIKLQTYMPFGFAKSREIPLKDVSAQAGPTDSKNYFPLKVRGSWFSLIIDQNGIYHNKVLFDKTVGLARGGI